MEPTQNSPSSKLHNPSIPLENSPWTSHFYTHQSWLNLPHYPSVFVSSNHPSRNFNLNQVDDKELDDQTSTDNTENHKQSTHENPLDRQREPMFEKPLTPSDVGKLNRLVIPKQHAERYFPLGGDSGVKGLLMSFEDESGKCWRFRYSYWNSSQSYVLTKGWSRYVKEKQLDAGDIILFQRHRTEGERLFIGWKRRGAAVVVAAAATDGGNAVRGNNISGGGGNEGWSSRRLHQGHPYLGHIQGHGANVPYQPDRLHAGSMVQSQEAAAAGNPKRRVRLFGVTLDCQLDESSQPCMPASSSVSSLQGPITHQFFSQSYTSKSNPVDILPRYEAGDKSWRVRSEDETSRN